MSVEIEPPVVVADPLGERSISLPVPDQIIDARETIRHGLHTTYDHVNLASLDEEDREALAYSLYEGLYEPVFQSEYGAYAVEDFERFTRMFHNPRSVLIIAIAQEQDTPTIVGFAIGVPGNDCGITDEDVQSTDNGVLPLPDDKTFYLGYFVRHPGYKDQKIGSGLWKTFQELIFSGNDWEKLCLYAEMKPDKQSSPMFEFIRKNTWIGFDELLIEKLAQYGTINDEAGKPMWQYVYMDLRTRINPPLVVAAEH